MKSQEWKTYRTRFLVKAKQLTSALSFTDHLGRQHCGRRGDYLVESFEGVITIAPRHIFEDIYVPMSLGSPVPETYLGNPGRDSEGDPEHVRIDELKIGRIQEPKSHFLENSRLEEPPVHPRVGRKSPQPVRHAPPRMGLM